MFHFSMLFVYDIFIPEKKEEEEDGVRERMSKCKDLFLGRKGGIK